MQLDGVENGHGFRGQGPGGLGASWLPWKSEKKADIILLDARKPHLIPLYNPYSHLVYSARGNDVTHSMINGRLVLENRRLLTLDLAEVLKKAKEEAQKSPPGVPKR